MRPGWSFARDAEGGVLRRRPLREKSVLDVVERYTDDGWQLVDDSAWEDVEEVAQVPFGYAQNRLLDGPHDGNDKGREDWLRQAIEQTGNQIRAALDRAERQAATSAPESREFQEAMAMPTAISSALRTLRVLSEELFILTLVRRTLDDT